MRSLKVIISMGVVAAVVSAQAQTYNFQSNFATANNPSGQFGYMMKTSFTTKTFTLLSTGVDSGGFKGWGQTSALAGAAIVKNFSGGTASIGSGSFAANSVVLLPTGGGNSVIRFTTPSAGAYRLAGTFAFMPTAASSDGVNVDIHTFSGTAATAVLDSFLLAPGGSTSKAFDITVSGLASGAFIDFSVSRGPANKTGDAVRLSGTVSAVPEPGTIAVFGIGLAALLRRRKAVKTA